MSKSVTLATPSGDATDITLSQGQSVGEQIRQMRKARGLSLRRTARDAGVSAAALSRWENDRDVPRVPELEAVLRALEADEAQARTVLLRMQVPRAVYKLRTLEGASAFASFGGDLLWALRRRKQWTQAETAAAAGVMQAQVARFENGDAWPSATVLHRLCWCLDAHPLEIEALTCHKDVSALPGCNGTTWADVKSWDETRWIAHLYDLLHYPPTDFEIDLHMLIVEQRLLHLAQASSATPSRTAFFNTFLADAYAIHARHCIERGQRESAARWAERGLSLKRKLIGSGVKLQDFTTFWFGSVLSLVTFLQESKRTATLHRAAQLLHEWLPVLPAGDTQHTWGQMSIAFTMVKLGQFDTALTLAHKACDRAATSNPYDAAMRWHDLAKVFLEVGKPAHALTALSESTGWWPLSDLAPNHAVRYHLLSARCSDALGNPDACHTDVTSAEQLVCGHKLHHLQAEVQSVAAIAVTL